MRRYSPFPLGVHSLVRSRPRAIIEGGTSAAGAYHSAVETGEGTLEEVIFKLVWKVEYTFSRCKKGGEGHSG